MFHQSLRNWSFNDKCFILSFTLRATIMNTHMFYSLNINRDILKFSTNNFTSDFFKSRTADFTYALCLWNITETTFIYSFISGELLGCNGSDNSNPSALIMLLCVAVPPEWIEVSVSYV